VLLTLLNKNGFNIVNEVEYNNHSIFYEIKKGLNETKPFESSKSDIFKENLTNNLNKIDNINNEIINLLKKDDYNVHIFGSHVMTQFYLYNGLTTKISSVLDNSPYKIGYK
jgi:uncharacterized membrane protein YgaE (UPF0421/DUF939 family)